MKDFKEREYEEVQGGITDNEGFYRTPNGSFWDPDGVYFNKDGVDIHGGKYTNSEYIPGPGWLENLLCYEDEKEKYAKEAGYSDYKEGGGEELDELYGDVDFDEFLKNEDDNYSNQKYDNHNHFIIFYNYNLKFI